MPPQSNTSTTGSSAEKPPTTLPLGVKPRDIPILPPGMRDESLRKIHNPIQKNWVYFTTYGREANGAYGTSNGTLQPGGVNRIHWHGSYSETFTALQGSVGIYSKATGKRKLALGESVTVKPGEPHYFFNDGDEEVVFEMKFEPAHEGFEKSLYVMYGLARDRKPGLQGVAGSVLDTAVFCGLGDIWPAGVTGAMLIPVLKGLRWVAKRSGREEKLVKRYWG
ncbi:hypothetical protein DM02DRAFT_616720 [Periconia macrospinosa]|uniref:Cupin type-2 domain-containing protein n=1 Tax=Periconia macrospinosa TaxID=97972 RepID=A0A2V1DG31_9PLEO|nr:hypothetical protein DM02DRAFT_616720 [Periconia macrospinosa]